ncbi:hypothetical protein ABID39_001259 [Bartonella japonica]|uniref:Uncharacterized protein n=1 Tax=Bartonella japonica TaxID=357761 RepID=A0ABV2FPQ5_9HYPH
MVETHFSQTETTEFQLLIKKYLMNNKNLFLKERVKEIEKWHNLIKERYEIAYSILGDMERKIYGMELVHNETQLKQHTKTSQILREITEIQIRITANKEKLKELDHEIHTLYINLLFSNSQ